MLLVQILQSMQRPAPYRTSKYNGANHAQHVKNVGAAHPRTRGGPRAVHAGGSSAQPQCEARPTSIVLHRMIASLACAAVMQRGTKQRVVVWPAPRGKCTRADAPATSHPHLKILFALLSGRNRK
jgi:hypothetical protein